MSANEKAVRTALKSLVNTNAATLVTGFTHQGIVRSIKQITTSTLTAPIAYYFVGISIDNVRSQVRRGFGGTTSVPPTEAEYDVVIELADYAMTSSGEDQMYETMDSDFQLFGDRLVDKIRNSRWIVDSVTGLRFRLSDDRLVTKANLTSIWEEAAQYHAMLYSRITFTLLEECVDNTTLYP